VQGRNKELESAVQELQAELASLKQQKLDLEAKVGVWGGRLSVRLHVRTVALV